MTDKEAIEYIEELMEYNRNGLLLTPQNNGFDTFCQCVFEHAIRALEKKERDDLIENKRYKVIKQIDMYCCDIGRITINPGTKFSIINGRVYFLNSENYLPRIVTDLFLSMKKNFMET